MKWAWARLGSWALALWLALTSLALAQSTGGSFGGSDWGGGGGSSSSSSGGSWSSSSGGYGSTASSANSYEPPVWGQLLIAIAFFAFMYWLFLWRGGLLRRIADRGARVDLTEIRLSLDARARRFVQGKLDALAKTGEGRTAEGRARWLAGVVDALEASRIAWLHGAVRNFTRMEPARAQPEHQRLVNEARATYQHELVRNDAAGTQTAAAPALTAREHEGEGVVLVTIVVAARREIPDVARVTPDAISGLLATLRSMPAQQVVAVDVVWTPAAENDRMSSDELEARHAGLTRIGGPAGRVFCTYCGGPFAAELPKCPHCGAPRS